MGFFAELIQIFKSHISFTEVMTDHAGKSIIYLSISLYTFVVLVEAFLSVLVFVWENGEQNYCIAMLYNHMMI